MVDVYLLIDNKLNVSHFVVSGYLWEKSANGKSNVFFFESVGLSMLRVHAAVIYDIFHHLVNHISQIVGNSIFQDVCTTACVWAKLLKSLLVKNIVVRFFAIYCSNDHSILFEFLFLLQHLNLAELILLVLLHKWGFLGHLRLVLLRRVLTSSLRIVLLLSVLWRIIVSTIRVIHRLLLLTIRSTTIYLLVLIHFCNLIN